MEMFISQQPKAIESNKIYKQADFCVAQTFKKT